MSDPGLPSSGVADPGLPPADTRSIRELEARNLGTPSLPTGAPRQEGLLKLAELGGAASAAGANWSQEDKDALFALLQTYRDELLALGMDAAELEAQLEQLKSRTTEVERRLEKLKPKDGLKVAGRFSAVMDDLHILGNRSIASSLQASFPLPGTTTVPRPQKKAGEGLRTQWGSVGGLLDFQGTRGPFGARAIFNVVAPFGTGVAMLGYRKIYGELRTPVAIQVGDLDVALTRLTLWRNETVDPYLPEPFVSREKRLHDDLLLLPNKWHMRGARASSELKLMDSLRLDVENILAVAAYSSNGSAVTAANTFYPINNTANLGYYARYNIYMEAWQLQAVFDEDRSLGYQGVLFWDDTNTVNSSPTWAWRSMNSLTHSFEARWAFGPVKLQAEYALSAYQAPALTFPAQPAPLTGTAYTASLGYYADAGYLKAFASGASSGYVAAGAQGRTVDASWQTLGPFLTENSQLNPFGSNGFPSPIAPSNASRLNDVLIPPSMVITGATVGLTATVSTYSYLLPYFAFEEIDPYGDATPNRGRFGAEGKWALFNKALIPSASYESSAMTDPVWDGGTNTYAAFSMSRIRAGLDLDLEPMLGWPVSMGGGYTGTTSANGSAAFTTLPLAAFTRPMSLNTTMIDGNLMLFKGRPMGLSFGYRMLTYKGYHPLLFGTQTMDAQTWDMMGGGAWWRPLENTSVDLVYSTAHLNVADYSNVVGVSTSNLFQNMEVDQFVLRMTTEF